MFGYEDIQLSLAYSAIYFFAALVLIAVYSIYVYRYTIPQIQPLKKILLVSLRILALLILCLMFFEPVLNFSRKLTLEPVNLIFVDNSRSMQIKDGTERIQSVKKILNDFSASSSESNLIFYNFGNSVRQIEDDSLEKLKFSDGSTNLAQIFEQVKNSDKNNSSITLVTDGVITSGGNPYYDALKLGINVFTIGIGDTTQHKDVEIKKILHNDFVYVETPTSIFATIINKGFGGQTVSASLYEDKKLLSQQTLILSNAGIQNIQFDYNPLISGEKKLSVQLSILKDEYTQANNKQIFYINVLSSKIKVSLLASSPNSDLTFIENSLRRDDNIEINSIVQLSRDKFKEKINYQIIDSADVFFLIGFPSEATPEELFNRVLLKIKDKKTPFFFTFSAGISLAKISKFGNNLPFSIMQGLSGYKEVQPYILPEQQNNPILQQTQKNSIDSWNNLPPVLQPNVIFRARIESKTLAQIKANNTVINSPLILLNNFSGRRSITVLAKDIWKWKLQVAPKGMDLFDSFIINSLRWLKAGEDQKLVKVKSLKKSFSQGERIEFSGEVFDESLDPISDADITLNISSEKNNYELDLQNIGSGLYEGSIMINETGDFKYNANARKDNILLGSDNGSFNIGEIDIEMINPVMNYTFLNLLSKETGGEFFFYNDYSGLLSELQKLKLSSSKEKIVTSEVILWSNTWMLIITILLLSLEWFIRKRNGML